MSRKLWKSLHGHFERIKNYLIHQLFTGLVDDNLWDVWNDSLSLICNLTHTIFTSFYLFKDEILLCLLVAAFIAEMILQFRKVSAIRGNKPAINMILNGTNQCPCPCDSSVSPSPLGFDFGLGLDNIIDMNKTHPWRLCCRQLRLCDKPGPFSGLSAQTLGKMS